MRLRQKRLKPGLTLRFRKRVISSSFREETLFGDTFEQFEQKES